MNETGDTSLPTTSIPKRRGRPKNRPVEEAKVQLPIVQEESKPAEIPNGSEPVGNSLTVNWIPIQVEDVVQVVNNESKYFGMMFIVGDIKEHRAHGYYLLTGGKHEYLTVGEDEVMLVGKKMKGHIRSKAACSPKWIADGK